MKKRHGLSWIIQILFILFNMQAENQKSQTMDSFQEYFEQQLEYRIVGSRGMVIFCDKFHFDLWKLGKFLTKNSKSLKK